MKFILRLALISSHLGFLDAQEIDLQHLYKIPILSQERLIKGAEISEALKDGIFYLEIPHDCIEYVEEALEFSYRFPNDEKIKEYKDGRFGGYHNREGYQIESFYVEKADWSIVLPKGIQQLALKMMHLSNILLEVALVSSNIPKQLWSEGTGLLTEGAGQNHFSFNHYQFEKRVMGIKPHQDFGFFSILYFEKAGLEAFYKGQWEPVPPLKDHFVVILGRALEMLVNDVSKLSGSWHRVPQLLEERVSFAITCDNDQTQAVKRYQEVTGELETVYENYQDYLTECFKQAYLPESLPNINKF